MQQLRQLRSHVVLAKAFVHEHGRYILMFVLFVFATLLFLGSHSPSGTYLIVERDMDYFEIGSRKVSAKRAGYELWEAEHPNFKEYVSLSKEERYAVYVSLPSLSFSEFNEAAIQAGFRSYRDRVLIAKIAYCEAGLKPQAMGVLTPSDWGLTQISLKYHEEAAIQMLGSREKLLEVVPNLRFAYTLFKEDPRNPLKHWSVHTTKRCVHSRETDRIVREGIRAEAADTAAFLYRMLF